MKKIFTIAIALIIGSTCAQSPNKMSYQAVIRNSSGALVTSQAVSLQISILQGSATGNSVYTETQAPTTNTNGLVSLEIGMESSTDDFSLINWADGPYFIKTETDITGGVSQLLSVPYALYAENGSKWKESTGGLYTNTSVGIGTSSLPARLNVSSSHIDTVNLILSNSTPAGSQLWMDAEASGGHLYKLVSTSSSNTSNPGFFGIKDETVVADEGNSNAWRLVIDKTGNVGIGTTSALSKLQVSGGDVYINDINSGVIMTSPNGSCWRITPDNSGTLVSTAITCP